MAFFDMYYDLADQLNDTADDNLIRTKKWVNWTLRDLVNMFNFPELQQTVTTTADAYNFNRILPIKTASTITFVSNDSSDTAVTATVYGYNLSAKTRTLQSENVALNGTATASTTSNFAFIDRIELAETLGDVTVSNGTGVISTILAGETVVGNDFKNIIKIDQNADVKPISTEDRLLQFPGDTNFAGKYYTQTGKTVQFYNATGAKTIVYQRKHPWMINDYEEVALFIEESDIVDAAWMGWGLRFEDEQGADNWKALYKRKLEEIIGNYNTPSDQVNKVVQSRRN